MAAPPLTTVELNARCWEKCPLAGTKHGHFRIQPAIVFWGNYCSQNEAGQWVVDFEPTARLSAGSKKSPGCRSIYRWPSWGADAGRADDGGALAFSCKASLRR